MSQSPSRPTSTVSRIPRCASPSNWSTGATRYWSSHPRRPAGGLARTARWASRSCECRPCRCPRIPDSGSACPARGCVPRWPVTVPTWCIWPARSCSGPAAAPPPGGCTCPSSRCTRRTCPPMLAPTIRAGPARRSAGGGCAGSTMPRTGRSPRARRPRLSCMRTGSSGSGCGPGASTAAGSTRPSGARGCGPSSRRAVSCWSATSGGWPWRSALTCWLRWRRCRAPGW